MERKAEPIVFTTTDPLGRKVLLKRDTWLSHIRAKHGEDIITEETIKKNIEDPIYITQNLKPAYDGSKELVIDSRRQDYWDVVRGNEHFFLLKTIVEFETENEGKVVTTYLLTKMKEMRTTGGIIYDRKQNKSTN